MSYQNGTTHYNLPQTVGTDKRDWSDTNQAFADVDAALYQAAQDASGAATDVSAVDARVTTLEGKMTTAEGDIDALQASDTTQDTTLLQHGQAITALQAGLGAATTVTDGTITPATGVSIAAASDIKTCNHVATIRGGFAAEITTTAENEILFTVSPAPATGVLLNHNISLQGNWIVIGTDGAARLRYAGTVGTVNFYATYVTA